MSKTQTTSADSPRSRAGLDLLVDVTGPRLRASLTDALRDAVRSGRLVAGTRLPASRVLATDLGIARSTVTECYAELVAEGWLTAQQGSGTRVATLVRPLTEPTAAAVTGPDDRRAIQGLVPGSADFAEFPRQQWLAAARRALAAAPYSAFGYGDPAGRMELRTALAGYLSRVRGVQTEAERIVICSGFHHGLALVAEALAGRGAQAIAVESYGLDLYRALLSEAGLRIPPLTVDDQGARIRELRDLEVGAVLLTPAHQFPTGVALSPERRAAVLDWARSTDGFILEDDYDGEFRYDRKPVGALQGLDPERVVYFGTASKSLAPALRVAWMVLPESLLRDVLAAKGRVETVSVLDQLTLAEFIASGAFDRHVRSRRQNYRRRRDQLIAALARRAPDVRVRGMAAGLQAVLELPAGTEGAVLRAAAASGLIVSGMAEYRHEALDPSTVDDGLVINYSAISDSAWEGALDLLCSVMPGR
ncbi:PLP-dependent aminotransferase family protein [Leifsonia sp. NPDC058248]|uniref:MocR-like pyridoxine biosynthesis transcription factor PdxR n=1 Tax=Leifsonia sp. NPDC058248 TaxID=3346402 RepID=UPI0036DB18B8